MNHSAHRRPRPHRVVPQRAAPQRRWYGLHKNGFQIRAGHLKHDRRTQGGNKNSRLYDSGHVHFSTGGLTVPSCPFFESGLAEPNFDGAHVDGRVENGVGAENLAMPSCATETQLLANQALAKQAGRELADLILKRIQTRLSGRIRNLVIHITDNYVELTGECRTYYTKQMAQHVAMGVLDYQQLVNNILVC